MNPKTLLRPLALTLLVGAVGCDNGEETPADGERPVERLAAAPEIPWLDGGLPIDAPVWTCPEGWTAASSAHGHDVCEPWAGGVRPTCGDHQIAVPGESACVDLGSACPSGTWPTDLPSTGVIRVDTEASEGGDGSLEAPFRTLGAAMSAAGAGDTIVVARGRYDEGVEVRAGVHLRGVCVAETVLTRSVCEDDREDAVLILGGDSIVRDLTIAEAECASIDVQGGTPTVHDVAILGGRRAGVRVRAGTATLHDVRVDGTRPRVSDGYAGQGVYVHDSGGMVLSRAQVSGNSARGLLLDGPGTTTLEDVTVSGTLLDQDGALGIGVVAQGGHVLSGSRLAVEDGHGGLSAFEGAEASLEDVVVRGHEPDTKRGIFGRCLELAEAADGTFSRIWGVGCSNVSVVSIGASVSITDGVFEDLTLGAPDLGSGHFVSVTPGASIRLERVIAEESGGQSAIVWEQGELELHHTRLIGSTRVGNGCGVQVEERSKALLDHVAISGMAACGVLGLPGSTVNATDVSIEGGSTYNAPGVDLMGQGSLRRVLVSQHHGSGAWIHRGGTISVEDSVFRDIMPDGVGDFGEGLWVGEGADAVLDRVAFENTGLLGILVDGSTLALTDVRIDTTRGDGDGLGGDGLYVRGDGEVSGSGLEIRGTRQAGLRLGPDASATLSGVWIANTDTMVCANGGCAESDAAVGVYVDGGTLELSDFGVVDNGSAGVVNDGGTVSLTDGGIAGSPIGLLGGATLQDVEFAENDENESTTEPPTLVDY